MDRQPNPHTLLRYVAGNAGALLVGLISAYVALRVSGTADPSTINIRTIDLMEFFSVAYLIVHGHGGLMYDPVILGHLQAHLIGAPLTSFGTLAYFCPPYFVLALAPLALLPYSAAYLVWLVVDCVLLAGALFYLESYANLSGRRALAFRGVCLSFLPVFMALGLGQASIVLLALFTVSFFALRSGHPVVAGLALAAASLKPAYVLPLLLVLLLRRQWSALAGFIAGVVALTGIAVPALGLSVYASYLRLLHLMTQWQGCSIHQPLWYRHTPIAPSTCAAQWNHSFAGFAELLLRPSLAAALTAALSVAALLVLARHALRSTSIDIPLAMAIPIGLLISPHTLAYDLSLLLIPAGVALRYRAAGPRYLPAFLGLGYAMVTVGYKLAFFVPLQISVLAMSGLVVWLFALDRAEVAERQAESHITPAPPSVRDPAFS